jgi:hypothetical protein
VDRTTKEREMIIHGTPWGAPKGKRRYRRKVIGMAADENDARAFSRDCKELLGSNIIVFYSNHEISIKAPAKMTLYYCGLYDGWGSRHFDDCL